MLRGLAFFGGGSGGHLFPGIAVAERARERFPGCQSVFFRTRRKVEERVLSTSGFATETLDLLPPAGGPGAWWRYSMQSIRAIESIRGRLTGKPPVLSGAPVFDAAIGLGGYASLPGILAARREGIPIILLEQNQVPGKVNRILAPFVDAISCPNDDVASHLFGRREVTGNPVRRIVLDAAFQRERWHWAGAVSSRRRQVVVVGGSQGARGINRAIVEALPRLGAFRDSIAWVHVSGDQDRREVASAYSRHGWEAQVHAYVRDLPEIMATADIVIGRAGGTTLAEISVLGVPAVLVPYPHHRDHHQLENAKSLVAAGGARLIEESELDATALEHIFRDLLFEPERLLAMEDGARSLARPRAADAVLDLVLELAETCR